MKKVKLIVNTKQKRKRTSTPRHLGLKNSPKKRQVKKQKKVKPTNTSILDNIFKADLTPDLKRIRLLKVGHLRLPGKELKLMFPSKMKKEAFQNLIIKHLISWKKNSISSQDMTGIDEPVHWSPPSNKLTLSPFKIVNKFPEKGV